MRKRIMIIAAMLGITGITLAGCSQEVSDTGTGTVQTSQETVSSSDSGEVATQASKAEYKQISQDEAANMMKELSDYIILDVRTEAEFAGGHIPNAICIPNETIDENVVNRLPDKEKTILVYCCNIIV